MPRCSRPRQLLLGLLLLCTLAVPACGGSPTAVREEPAAAPGEPPAAPEGGQTVRIPMH